MPPKPQPQNQQHNLDIHTYSLQELLQLFELPNKIQDLDQFDLKKAKRKYQLLHPDKSGLPNNYFLFYQKAYQKIEDEYLYYFPTATKRNSNPSMTYQPYQPTTVDKRTQKQVSTALQSMRPEEFQRHMNEMYEQHMATKQDTRRADWMRQDAPTFENLPTTLKSQDDIANQMAQLKQQQQNQLIRHRQLGEVEYLTQSHGQRFYDDDDDDDPDGEEALDKYITSDPFSKLKFEDVRKVHGAETILLEPSQQPQPRSYQQQKQEFSQSIQPMDKNQSQALLEKLQKEAQIKAEKARQNSMYKIQNYEEKNKTILNSFLRIGNSASNTF
jgi:hypothetical protein